jgi:hypothetical protein
MGFSLESEGHAPLDQPQALNCWKVALEIYLWQEKRQ